MIVMYPRCRFVRAVNSVSKHSSVSRSSSPVIRTRLSKPGFRLANFDGDFPALTTTDASSRRPASSGRPPAIAGGAAAGRGISCVPSTAAFSNSFSIPAKFRYDADPATSDTPILVLTGNDLTDADWRSRLTPQQYSVLRQKGTERAFTGCYWNTKQDGMYECVCCGQPLFDASTKFDSGTGWPSFWQPIAKENVTVAGDNSYGMVRDEKGLTGGIGDAPQGMPGGVTFYVHTEDPKGTLARIEKLGGRVLMPLTEVAPETTIALFADPEGHVVGLM